MRQKFLLYRIIGNDLPPRHSFQQTLRNIKFILDHEPDFNGVEKRWVINRVLSDARSRKICRLLEARSQHYKEIRLDVRKARSVPRSDFHGKVNALIALNQARNEVLREGRGVADWVMPFDANCFLTEDAWGEILQGIADNPDDRYVVVPMVRIVDKRIFYEKYVRGQGAGSGQDTEKIGIFSEPQVMFRADFEDDFDENFPYGYLSKADLLWRLDVPGPWIAWGDQARAVGSIPSRPKSRHAGEYISAGKIWRLPSGNVKAEKNLGRRDRDRTIGILYLMDRVDHDPLTADVGMCLRILRDQKSRFFSFVARIWKKFLYRISTKG